VATPCVEVWQTSNLRPLRLGEEKKKKERRTNCSMQHNGLKEKRKERKKAERKKIETTGQKYNGLPYYIGRP